MRWEHVMSSSALGWKRKRRGREGGRGKACKLEERMRKCGQLRKMRRRREHWGCPFVCLFDETEPTLDVYVR